MRLIASRGSERLSKYMNGATEEITSNFSPSPLHYSGAVRPCIPLPSRPHSIGQKHHDHFGPLGRPAGQSTTGSEYFVVGMGGEEEDGFGHRFFSWEIFNSISAMAQSSSLSISTTRYRGRIHGVLCGLKILFPSSQACGRPQ